ncbi:energy transducer TonB [Adhaeribacter terreus]|uniref:Energy transducer TonB n=1 Tax=Adhaeribacter terreus TaxID=529703 RepID=A0ABW0E8G9_9BACT
MTSSNFATQTTFDDIVFEGRNREYGAYLLRKIYTRNLYRGLVAAIMLFMLFLSLPLIINKLFPKEFVDTPSIPTVGPMIIEDIIIPPLPEEITPPPAPADVKPPQEATPAAGATQEFIEPVITANGHKTMIDVNLPPGIEPGKTTSEGNGGTGVIPNTGTGTTGGEIIVPENKIFEYVEVNPEFPGGQTAMMKYLSENIRYPSLAERNRLEGLVVVQFVVNEEGRISGLTILKNLGGGTDEEAMRVIKNMPTWKPGMQNGTAVKVRYTLPIRFTLKR